MSEKKLKIVSVRLVEEQPWLSEKELSSPEFVAEFLSERLRSYDRELFCILNMSTQNQVINMNIASMGTLNMSLVHPREVFKSAILSNANSVILVHNHLSGLCSPSKEDVLVTKRLEECGELLGISVLDHIITGALGNYYSFKAEGMLTNSSHSTQLIADRVQSGRSR